MVIPVFSKYTRPVMATLNKVVRAICQYNTCLPWHLHSPVLYFRLTLGSAVTEINQIFPKINLSPLY